ncbi:Zn-dependent protease (includes SpoIVFB) [Clostridium amylolyticum]|uniref:Zn-dependent protease (Includes SpoIVFB) n=1 Tax=Clostridium amylolyticum TaxID=1121298 RepID=A0A1M6KVB5_9CLOT|nr:site-2 protease family protein [Clostridium amylolyticum]SHJ62830.1 Zn-dependent protease (includes SpoIVFB) [Clostridium amylolyticum]
MFFQKSLLQIVLTIPAILIGFTFHEYAHALVADKLGDKTPRFQGRLTLNPFAHIDPIGFIMILLFGFGWAKPVQVNSRAFKNYYKDDLKVSIAGPIANLIVAFITAIIYGLLLKFHYYLYIPRLSQIIDLLFNFTILINVNLFLFNLLPLPGLDGFHILEDLFPRSFYKYGEVMYKYQMLILLLVVGTNVIGFIIGTPAKMIFQSLLKLAFSIAV